MKESEKSIEQFWDANPVGSNFISYYSDKSFYEKYDQFRYSTEGHILGELDLVGFDSKVVLEIGLGQGADSMQIINRGAFYHGIDLTEESVKRLTERFRLYEKKYVSVIKASAVQIPHPDNYFDIVYSHGVIHHSPQIEEITKEIHRVLKPGGRAVIMLYNKSSVNYYISIAIMRRVGLLMLFAFPFLTKLISKATGESVERINKHKQNFREKGWSYLLMRNFVHRSTDGPDNVYATVWTKRSARKLFSAFQNISFRVHFLNERHLLGFQKILPKSVRRWMAQRWGWHLWVFVEK